jgi:hypothetical protein
MRKAPKGAPKEPRSLDARPLNVPGTNPATEAMDRAFDEGFQRALSAAIEACEEVKREVSGEGNPRTSLVVARCIARIRVAVTEQENLAQRLPT